jgi:hypothetical protein
MNLQQAFVTFAISNNRICKTLEIFLPARLPELIHSFRGQGGVYDRAGPVDVRK